MKHAVRPAAGCFSHSEEISRGIHKMITTEVGIIILSGGGDDRALLFIVEPIESAV